MRTPTNLLTLLLLAGACEESLPPSPYSGFGQAADPIGSGMDGGAPEADASADSGPAADAEPSADASQQADGGLPEVPPLVPKTDCDPARRLDAEFDPAARVGLASNGKGTAALSWTSGEPRKQYVSVFRDGSWDARQQVASEAPNSAVLGIDDSGGTYAFWWEAAGLTGRKLDTADDAWSSARTLDPAAATPVRPEPYVVSPNGISLFVRDGATARSVVRYASDLAPEGELEISPPGAGYEPDQLTHLLASTAGEAVVLSTWRAASERRLVPYFQAEGELRDGDALDLPESITTDQIAAVMLPSGDLAVVAAEATATAGRLWVRRVARDSGTWSSETVLEKRNIEGRRFTLRAALANARGMLTAAWIDGEQLMVAQETEDGFSKAKAIALENPDSAALSLDGDGNLTIVYADSGGLMLRQLAARDGSLFPPFPIANHTPTLVRVTHDAASNVLVAWEEDGLRVTTCRAQSVGE